MFRSAFFKFFIVTSFLAFMFCNKDSGVSTPEEIQYGTITGKVIHPDTNLVIRVMSDTVIDTAARNPVTQMFTFDSIKAGNCILQVRATGYGLFEETIILDKPIYVCHDIVLTKIPVQIRSIYPANSQYLDSLYFILGTPSVTDTGFYVFMNFSFLMDTISVNKALTIKPDTVGVLPSWASDQKTFSIFWPYRKLCTIDTIKVTVGSKAINEWKDTLTYPCTVFYPVDANYIRANWLKKK